MISRERLVLGTAKLGMPWYGYNSTSRPTAAESIALLRHAWRKGITMFDSALGYGDAMALLSEAGVPASHIVTKCRLPLVPPHINDAALDLGARARNTLRQLNIKSISELMRAEYRDILGIRNTGRRTLAELVYAIIQANSVDLPARVGMLSGYDWLIHNPTIAQLADVMIGCGVSVYTVAEVAEARRLKIAPIQAPASCLNPAVDVEYGRAPFLQGVLLRPAYLAPPALEEAVSTFQLLAMTNGISPLVLALHAAYGERLVFGVSSLAQLDAVLTACAQPTPDEELIAAARALASTAATAALPSLWSKP